eukprot:TRINITY_DN35469_c0_g1_i1.p1 TRINITY_DN35469_c0_g1~~TRINITY_DN35469_c0_g1_i1.p1  ORF type:complete len:340 (-),score=35.00 TRINITY_DN35469_c0_g1_i1:152-1171(-)
MTVTKFWNGSTIFWTLVVGMLIIAEHASLAEAKKKSKKKKKDKTTPTVPAAETSMEDVVIGAASEDPSSSNTPDTEFEIPQFPTQFSAKIRMKAKNCDPSTYPLCERVLRVYYDLSHQRAVVKWSKNIESVNSTIIKRYDLGREYELKYVCPSSSKQHPSALAKENTAANTDGASTANTDLPNKGCKWVCSRMELHDDVVDYVPDSEYTIPPCENQHETPSGIQRCSTKPSLVPPPILNAENTQLSSTGTHKIGGVECIQWVITLNGESAYYCVTPTNHNPVKLETDTMIYLVENYISGPPQEPRFVIPHHVDPKVTCVPNSHSVGLPYQHVLHHFIRI